MGEFEPNLQEKAALKKQEIKNAIVYASAASVTLGAAALNAYGVVTTRYDVFYGTASVFMGIFGLAFLAQTNAATERYIALDNPNHNNPLDK